MRPATLAGDRRIVAFVARFFALVLVVSVVANCATSAREPGADGAESGDTAYDDAAYDDNDPFEAINRGIFAFNRTFDGLLFKPISIMYVGIVPLWGRERIRNVLNNLGEPVNLANNLLQGDFERAGITLGRFTINSTLGVAGLFDVADGFGLPYRSEDFGQTLSVWGFAEGPYLMLPLLGPSSPRDVIGLVADVFLDPFTYILERDLRIARTATRGLDERSRNIDTLDSLEETSIDFYTALRELFRQHRDNAIRNGVAAPTVEIPSVTIDDYDDYSDYETEDRQIQASAVSP